jgi:hypothetical protein
MNLRYLVLLTAALATSIEAASTVTTFNPVTSDLPSFARSSMVEQGDSEAQRLLRVESSEDDEERAISIKSIPGLDKLKKMPVFEKLTQLFKTRVTPGTFMNWAKKGKSPDYVFQKLKLNAVPEEKLFSSVDFPVWVAYVRLSSKTNADAAISGALVARYGDVALNKMVETALKVNPADDVASMLQKKQFDDWANLGLGSDDVFKLLKLDDGLDGLLANPNLSAWDKYVQSTGGSTGTKTPLINALRAHYDDAALLKMLVAAKKNPETANVAKSLEGALVGQLRLNRVKNGH